jgi:peptidoglycan/LPS O-acetylase OafA/YrhL
MSNQPKPYQTDEVSDWYANTNYFDCLNGLRAISIIAVVWHHTASSGSHLIRLLDYGYHGVTLFFLISGFLITTLLLKEKDRKGKIDLVAFFARRSLRIFPLYYAILLAYVVLVFVQEGDSSAGTAFFSNLKYYATYTSNIFVPLDGRVIFYFAWSLAAEEQFYLVLAPLLALVNTKSAALVVTLISVGLVLANMSGLANPVLLGKMAPMGIWLGTLSAFLLREKRMAVLIEKLLGTRWSAPILILITIYLLETQILGEAGFVVGSAALLIALLLASNTYLSALLNQKILIHIGKVSYGIYLQHMICKAIVVKGFSTFGLNAPKEIIFITVLLMTIGVATLSFNSFERFFLSYKTRFSR